MSDDTAGVYLPERDANHNVVWHTDADWVPLPWDDVPILADIPKPAAQAPPAPARTKGRKRFACAVCRKMYARRPDANIHVLEIHVRFFRFQCRDCEFKTSRNYHLTKHIGKTGHKPWNLIHAHRVKPHYRYTAPSHLPASTTPPTPITAITTPVDTFSPITPQ